jgi:non-ribosomal peptide synthetase component F
MVLLSAFQVLLSRYSGQQDVVVGSPIAGRTHRETEGMIGFFVNTLVLRTDLSGNPGFRELLRRVKEVTLGAYAHQELPFEKLVLELRPDRRLSHQPLFQVVLALQNYPHERLEFAGLSWIRMNSEHVTSQFDLVLHLFEDSDRLLGASEGLRGIFEYATDLFDPETVERMATNFRILLEGIVAYPDCPIA